jgi:hypothetical protein
MPRAVRLLCLGLLALSGGCCKGACWPAGGVNPFESAPKRAAARDAAPARPAARAPASAPSPASPAPAAEPAPPVDESAAAPGSARASLAAAPPWASRRASRFSGDDAVAPQPESADDLFRTAARPFLGELAGGGWSSAACTCSRSATPSRPPTSSSS